MSKTGHPTEADHQELQRKVDALARAIRHCMHYHGGDPLSYWAYCCEGREMHPRREP